MSPRGRRNRLSSIHAIADELRQSSEAVGTPDFASSILSRVEVQRPFLCERTRQMIWVGRAAVGLSVAVMALGVALLYRWSPDTADLAGAPAPASMVLRTVQTNVSETTQNLATFGQMKLSLADEGADAQRSVSQSNSGLFTTLWVEASKSAPADAGRSGLVGPTISVAQSAQMRSTQLVIGGSFNYNRLAEAVGCEQSPWPPAVTRVPARPTGEFKGLGLLEVAPLQFDGPGDSAITPK